MWRSGISWYACPCPRFWVFAFLFGSDAWFFIFLFNLVNLHFLVLIVILLRLLLLFSSINEFFVNWQLCLIHLNLNYKFQEGFKPIYDIATSDLKLYFTPKLAHFGLKMIIRHFSSKFWKKILTPIFTFLAILKLPKNFFSKIFLRESYLLPGFLR